MILIFSIKPPELNNLRLNTFGSFTFMELKLKLNLDTSRLVLRPGCQIIIMLKYKE